MLTNANPPVGGYVTRELDQGVRFTLWRGRSTPFNAGATYDFSVPLPPNFAPAFAMLRNAAAATLATATRVALGTSAATALFLLSGTTMTAGTRHGPVPYDPSGQVFSNVVASAAVTNTTTETAFTFTGQTVPAFAANTLKPGDRIRIRWQGIATATNSTDTLAIKAYLGTVEVAAAAAVDVANNDVFQGVCEVLIRKVGANGTCVAATLQPVTGAAKSDGSSAVTVRSEFKGSQAIDTTAAITPSVTATWSVANAGNSCRLDVLSIDLIRTAPKQLSASGTTVRITAADDAGVAAGTVTTGVFDAFIWGWAVDPLPDATAVT